MSRVIGTRVVCRTCGYPKAPRGRSVPMEMATSMCSWECPGYDQEPNVGQLWPDETADGFGYPVSMWGSDVEV